MIEQGNFEHNTKEIKNAYEESLLSCGEFDERMFLNEGTLVRGNSRVSSPVYKKGDLSGSSLVMSPKVRSARINLSQVTLFIYCS